MGTAVRAAEPLLSHAVLEGTANVQLSVIFGFNGKNDKSYQKYHRDEKYEVFATSSHLGNRE